MYLTHQSDPRRQVGGIAFVVLLHVGIVYALLNGLGHRVVEVLRLPLQTQVIKEAPPPPPEVKRAPPPKLAPPPPPYIPPPEVRIQTTAPSQNAIAAVTSAKPVEPPPAPPPPQVAREPVRALPVMDRASYHEPEYPATSRRLEEAGSVLLQLLVDVDGTVAESKVAQSSGFPRLDEAARLALSKCRFKPGTVDGKPERVWLPYKYTWRLN